MDWIWWIFQGLPFQHLVRVMDCFFHEGVKVSLTANLPTLETYKATSFPGAV